MICGRIRSVSFRFGFLKGLTLRYGRARPGINPVGSLPKRTESSSDPGACPPVRVSPRPGRLHQQCDEAGKPEPDFVPVVKLFTPNAGCTWLLTEIDPDNPNIAFGLCDLGMGCPELGSVSLSELESVRGRLGLPVERDLHFHPTKMLSIYADEARAHGAIKA